MIVSGGRRLLLALFLAPLLYLYWSRVRYWKPSRVLAATAFAGVLILAVSVLYSNFRFYNAHTRENRTATGVLYRLSKLRQGVMYSICF